jgi:hypothetical protein
VVKETGRDRLAWKGAANSLAGQACLARFFNRRHPLPRLPGKGQVSNSAQKSFTRLGRLLGLLADRSTAAPSSALVAQQRRPMSNGGNRH